MLKSTELLLGLAQSAAGTGAWTSEELAGCPLTSRDTEGCAVWGQAQGIAGKGSSHITPTWQSHKSLLEMGCVPVRWPFHRGSE